MFDKEQPAYIAFRNIAKEGTDDIVAWVGAGLSVPAGLPSWSSLMKHLADVLDSKAATLEHQDKIKEKGRAEAARNAGNLWISFQILREALGEVTYTEEIRKKFALAANCKIPIIYERLWRMGIAGMLNLNIDRLGTRAYNNVFEGKAVAEFEGKKTGGMLSLLRSPEPFLANLHGEREDPATWVFTNRELTMLLQDKGYEVFINAVFSSTTVVFIGITADDEAVGGHLTRLKEMGVKLGNHFWVSDRCDAKTDKWAEASDIRMIRYENASGKHEELEDMFTDLEKHIPKEENISPIVPTVSGSVGELLPPNKMAIIENREEIREILNSAAAQILLTASEGSYTAYREFRRLYGEAIMRCWYVTDVPPDNTILGYEIQNKIGEGAFATVYSAYSPDNELVALKLLHVNARDRDDFLQGFRRGIRSMQILSDSGVKGVAAHIASFEIPALVVMELIDGPTLQQLGDSKKLNSWYSVLRIAKDVTQIIHTSQG